MPQYRFENPSNPEEFVDVFFHMNDTKTYIAPDGKEWRRKYFAPLAAVDTQIDPNNKNDFIRRGEKYKDLGSVMDKSKELSEKRESKEGKDPIKEAYFNKYNSDRGGNKPHPLSRPKKIETPRVVVDLT